MENTRATLDFPGAKTAPQILALLKTTLRKVADSAPYRAIMVFFYLGWGQQISSLNEVLTNNERKLRLISNIYSVVNKCTVICTSINACSNLFINM